MLDRKNHYPSHLIVLCMTHYFTHVWYEAGDVKKAPRGLGKQKAVRKNFKRSCGVRVRQLVWANANHFSIPFMKLLKPIDTAAH